MNIVQKIKALLMPFFAFLVPIITIIIFAKMGIGGAYFYNSIAHIVLLFLISSFSLYASYRLYKFYLKNKNTEIFILGISFYVFSLFFFFHSFSVSEFYFFDSKVFDITEHYGIFFGSLVLLSLLLPLKITSSIIFKHRVKIFFVVNVLIFLFFLAIVFIPFLKDFFYSYLPEIKFLIIILLFILTLFFAVSYSLRSRILKSPFLLVGFSLIFGASIIPYLYSDLTVLWWFFHIFLFIGIIFIFIDILLERRSKVSFKDIFSQASIASKLIFGFGVIALLFFSIVLSLGLRMSSDSIINSTLEVVEGQTKNHALRVESFIVGAKNDVLFLSALPIVRDGLSESEAKDRLANIFSEILLSKKIYSSLSYIDESGNELVRVDYKNKKTVKIKNSELSLVDDLNFFEEVIKKNKGEVYVSDFILDKDSFNQSYFSILQYASPVVDLQGNKKGIIVASVFGNYILEEVKDAHKENYGIVFVVDDDGYYIFHPNSKKEWGGPKNLNTGENIKKDFPDLAKHVLSGESLSMVGDENILSHTPVFLDDNKSRFIVIGMVIPKSVVLSDLIDFRGKMVMLIVFILVFFIGFAYLLVRNIVRPIKHLSLVSEKVSIGDFSQRARVNTKDEVGILSKNFNLMIDSLVYANKNLENKVRARTKDLANKIKELDLQISETKRFQEAVNSATDSIIITDKNAHILYVNPAWEKATGYKKEEVLGKNPKMLQSGKTPKRVYTSMWKKLSAGKPFITDKIINVRKNGEEYQEYLSVVPIIENGETVYYVGMSQDITKQKEIDRMKTEFVSVASHQLRTPLTAIRLFVEMLLKDGVGRLNKTQKEYLENIEKSTNRMILLVNDLLNVSRLDTGRITVSPEQVQMEDLIEDAIEEVLPLADQRKCSIVFKKPNKKTKKVSIDPSLIRQAIHNLLTNAIKYSPLGKKCEVVVTLKKTAKEYIISVSDHGMGIPEDVQSRVFSKFFRADNAVKQETEGTGLGLYIVYTIMKTMGGKVWFNSKEGEGSTFYISFPAKGVKAKKGEKRLA